jgi:hypothetical protein
MFSILQNLFVIDNFQFYLCKYTVKVFLILMFLLYLKWIMINQNFELIIKDNDIFTTLSVITSSTSIILSFNQNMEIK